MIGSLHRALLKILRNLPSAVPSLDNHVAEIHAQEQSELF
jgi:hypothetical protein